MQLPAGLSFYFLKKLILSNRSKSLVRRISILSFAAITLSVAVFFIVLFVMNGMNRNIRSRILALDPNITAHLQKADPSAARAEQQGQNHPAQNEAQIAEQEKPSWSDEIEKSIAYDSYDLILRTVDGQFKGAQAIGYPQGGLDFWFEKLKQIKKNNTRYSFEDTALSEQNLNLEENEIAIGIDLARSLQLLEGDQVTLIPAETLLLSQLETPVFEKVTIKKIIATDLADLDTKLAFFNKDLSLRRMRTSLSRAQGVHFWVKNSNRIADVRDQIQKTHPEFVRVETWQEKNSDLFFALFMEKTMIGVFLGLAGLIASSSILTVLVLLMSQKRMDIAMLKTLGLSNHQTLWLFTKMGLWISLSGLLLGSLIGLSVSYYLQFYPLQVLPDYYYDSSIPALVNLSFALAVIVVVALLALLGCLIPARATLKIEPAILLKRS